MNVRILLYSGKDSVRNGEFEFEFKMPVELNYSSETGLLNLYGYDEQGREAQGSNEQFVVGDMDNDVRGGYGRSDYPFYVSE